MRWPLADAKRHTLKANTDTLRALGAIIANDCPERTRDEGRGVHEVNAANARAAQSPG